MGKHIGALAFIYVCVCAAWLILGNTFLHRTFEQDGAIRTKVKGLWGPEHTQQHPVFFMAEEPTPSETTAMAKAAPMRELVHPSASKVDVKLDLVQRKKGLLWYPTYKVHFAGTYTVSNKSDQPIRVGYQFPLSSQNEAVYDNLTLTHDKSKITDLHPNQSSVEGYVSMLPGQTKDLTFSYDTQGMYNWKYEFQKSVTQVKNFALNMITDFDAIDFPDGSRSPTSKDKLASGWSLGWRYDNTTTGHGIGMSMPKLLNPGPWVSDVTFFAPVSLFFFFFAMWLITSIRSIRIHPMHYFFMGSAFFAFQLMLAYLVDHVSVEMAFAISSLVSLALVLTYIRRAVPDRTFFVQVAGAQIVYQIFFSYSFFFEQCTGLIITLLSVATLFLSMQYTARFDWNRVFNKQLAAEDPLAIIDEAYG